MARIEALAQRHARADPAGMRIDPNRIRLHAASDQSFTKREGILTKHMWMAGLAVVVAGTTAQAQETLKIGVNETLTGAVAASGTYLTNRARTRAEVVNSRGGVLGKKIELVIEDNKSNPKEAVDAAEKLILRDKVPVMIGAWSSTFTLAVMPKLMEYGVPLIVETSSSGKITVAGNPWVFRISPTSEMEAIAFVEKLGSFNPPIKKADFLSVNNDFGRGAAAEFSKALASKGIKVGVTETMTPEATDLSAQLARIEGSEFAEALATTGVEVVAPETMTPEPSDLLMDPSCAERSDGDALF